MKVIFILAAMVAAVVARPEQLTPGVVPILDYQLVQDEYGQYALSYVSGDGTKITEQGALVPNDEGTGNVLVKKGTVNYFAPDGTAIEETWTADKTGFNAKGDHLPKPPPAV